MKTVVITASLAMLISATSGGSDAVAADLHAPAKTIQQSPGYKNVPPVEKRWLIHYPKAIVMVQSTTKKKKQGKML